MVWVRTDEKLHHAPEFVEAGPLAFALFEAALGHSNEHGMDGYISRPVARKRLIDFDIEVAPGQVVEVDPDFIIGKLLRARCSECDDGVMRWRQTEGGYLIHDHHQPTKAEIAEQQAKKAAAGSKGGQARAANRAQANGKHAPSTSQARGSAVPEPPPKQNGSPIRPDPSFPLADASGPPGGRADPPALTVIDGGADAAEVLELEPAEVLQAEVVAAEPVTAQTLLGEYIDACEVRPPQRVIGHLSRELKQLVVEGIDLRAIRAGLAIVRERGLHPSTLASAVNEALNPPRPRMRGRPAGKAERQLDETLTTAADMLRMGPPGGGGGDDLGGLDADRGQAQRALAGPADQRRHGGRVVDGPAALQRR